MFMCLGMVGCQQKDVEIRIIPQPQSVETTSGTYRLQKQATFTSNLPETEGKEFAEYVQASPLGLQLSTEESRKKRLFSLSNCSPATNMIRQRATS